MNGLVYPLPLQNESLPFVSTPNYDIAINSPNAFSSIVANTSAI